MFNKVECVTLTCDNCQVMYKNDDTGFTAFLDKEAASEDAESEEWYMQGEKHYCPDCFKINDEDELIIDTTRTMTPPTEPNTVDNVLSDEEIEHIYNEGKNFGQWVENKYHFGKSEEHELKDNPYKTLEQIIAGYKAALQSSPIK